MRKSLKMKIKEIKKLENQEQRLKLDLKNYKNKIKILKEEKIKEITGDYEF